MNSQVQLDMDALARFCRKWRIRELSLFGSALRDDLMSIVKREVDLVVKEALRNPYRRKEILTHREAIYAA